MAKKQKNSVISALCVAYGERVPKDAAHISLAFGKTRDEISVQDGIKRITLAIPEKKRGNMRALRILARKAVFVARREGVRTITISFREWTGRGITPVRAARMLAENMAMANYEFVALKTPPKEGWIFIDTLIVRGDVVSEAKKEFAKGLIIAKWVNRTRSLANTPGGLMTPAILAQHAIAYAKEVSVPMKVFGKKDLAQMGAGAILGVAQGSVEEPKLIVAEYRGGKKNEKPIVLVGKGVTFDTGGINLKPSDHILGMNMDMSGGAAVLCSLFCAAELGMERNVTAVVPAVENMPSGSSYRPGDVLRGMSGKTIEILNTDAEGRVILSDALTYAKKFNPSLVVDVATLTGAAHVALGAHASAIFTSDDTIAERALCIAEESGDYVWRLPLWEEYEEEIKGTFGDVTNTNNKNSRYGGASHAAAFLWQFVKDAGYPWLHIDIAPRTESAEGEFLAKGAAGAPVRMLMRLIEDNT
ncbi:MAG: leucyl aminopeptidase family protein [Patescibacteria group bacterium]